ncbi:MAG: hypothetical protein KGD63_07640 [Candidatus Lokiarchaeota archaeon]|nr:hypothetical protein [Candidatus Lokiarchaeota archaeon]
MVDILLNIKTIINYTKKDIDKGNTPPEIYKICSCIREAFCLSYAIRKENRLWLYFQKVNSLIELNGSKLRFLGSDERSQALLLMKALDLIKFSTLYNWKKSTPGIFVRKFEKNSDFFLYINSNMSEEIVFIPYQNALDFLSLENNNKMNINIVNIRDLKNIEEKLYIISLDAESNDFLNLYTNYKIDNDHELLEKIKIGNLINIEGVENKILYLNYLIDTQLHIKK